MSASSRAHSIEDLRRRARTRLPRAVFDFFDGGAEDERALHANRATFCEHSLVPRILRNVADVSLDTCILGSRAAMPVIVAPTGAVGFGRRGGDVSIARAAARHGIPYSLSTSATASIEDIVAEAAPAQRWFQAYIFRKREITKQLIDRARNAGYEGLVITVDLPVGGKRERDFRNHFSIPFRFTPRNFLDFASHPKWAIPMLLHGLPPMPNLAGLTDGLGGASAIASSVGRNYDASFAWQDLKAIREQWQGKLIVKGIVHVDDARRAADFGVDAISISNHGGRQLDAGIAPLTALPALVDAVGREIEIYVDGGVRRGSDIVIALALGAKAVMVGRATLYGVCADGEAGATRALDILREELRRTMQLCGLARTSEIDSRILTQMSG